MCGMRDEMCSIQEARGSIYTKKYILALITKICLLMYNNLRDQMFAQLFLPRRFLLESPRSC